MQDNAKDYKTVICKTTECRLKNSKDETAIAKQIQNGRQMD